MRNPHPPGAMAPILPALLRSAAMTDRRRSNGVRSRRARPGAPRPPETGIRHVWLVLRNRRPGVSAACRPGRLDRATSSTRSPFAKRPDSTAGGRLGGARASCSPRSPGSGCVRRGGRASTAATAWALAHALVGGFACLAAARLLRRRDHPGPRPRHVRPKQPGPPQAVYRSLSPKGRERSEQPSRRRWARLARRPASTGSAPRRDRPVKRGAAAGQRGPASSRSDGRVSPQARASGAPKGIRTPDLHLERVAS